MSYLTVTGHRAMALDARRNDAYHAALAQAIRPDSVVLDLGAGTGVHGVMAARLGAKRVYLVEPEDVVLVAEEIVRANGVQDRVHCLQGRIEDIDLPERVDVIVSVLTGNFLLTEDLLKPLFYARDTVLKPGGRLIPSAASMEAVPVSWPAAHDREIAGWSRATHGVDLGPARVYAANTILYRVEGVADAVPLAEPQVLRAFDFHADDYTSVHAEAAYDVRQAGACHGLLGWFSMQLGDRRLSTSPWEPTLHWSPAWLPLDPPVALEPGDRLCFELDRPPFGDWTWRVRTSASAQEHSTLLSAPLTLSSLRKAALSHAPCLGEDGRAVMHVLSACDGTQPVTAIAESLRARYPGRYRATADAVAFVQRIVKRYA